MYYITWTVIDPAFFAKRLGLVTRLPGRVSEYAKLEEDLPTLANNACKYAERIFNVHQDRIVQESFLFSYDELSSI